MKTPNCPGWVLLAGLTLGGCDSASESALPQPRHPADAVLQERGLDPVQVARGRAVYDRHCAECHGDQGTGQPGDWRVRNADGSYPPPPLDDTAHAWHHPTAVLLESVREGSPPGMGNMPAWKDRLSEQQMQDVVAYIKSLWSEPVYRIWRDIERRSQEE